jgi:hypothetical protein
MKNSIIPILYLLLLSLFIPIWIKYTLAKTIKNKAPDCMIEYVNNYYPNGCTYLINWDTPHIDKCWMWNNIMVETKEIHWCYINDSVSSILFNTPYCYVTLFLEKGLK